MPATENQTDVIFWKAQEIPSPERRAAYLDQACAGDAQLRAQLDELLAAHPKVARFLEIVLEQIEDQDLSLWFQNIVRGGDRLGGDFRVMQGLA